MSIQEWSDKILSVDLPEEPDMLEELKEVLTRVHGKMESSIVIDFSAVTMITEKSFMTLLKIRRALTDKGHRLILVSIASATKGIFVVTGLEEFFQMENDKSVGLNTLQISERSN